MNAKEISKLMNQFEHSNLNEFRIAQNGSSVYFSKLDRPGAVAQQNKPAPAPEAPKPARPTPAAHHDHTADEPKPKQSAPGKTISAPLVGIVYFAPSPKKPAFAKVGSHVSKGDVVCQIEAMKVLNDVKAPVSGTIEKRLVKNGAMVQYHQPIFLIKED